MPSVVTFVEVGGAQVFLHCGLHVAYLDVSYSSVVNTSCEKDFQCSQSIGSTCLNMRSIKLKSCLKVVLGFAHGFILDFK